MLKRIAPEDVRLGMYVQGFEGSWLRHPFWRSRFLLEDEQDLARIRACPSPVLIDDEKGLAPAPASRAAEPAASPLLRRAQLPLPIPRTCSAADERPRAEAVVRRSARVMRDLLDGVRLGRAVQYEQVLDVVEEITASVKRNAQALIGIVRLKTKDNYTYLHSVAVCALMSNLARELGLGVQQCRELGMAGLLHDIGKMAVPAEILNKVGALSDAEFAIVRRHPERGAELLAEAEDLPAAVLDVCLHHHERIDGTGYPHRLPGPALSLAARMGAICGVYDALTSSRAYKGAWTPVEALTAMTDWHGQFDRALLFRFMQSIGLFAPGLLVRLASNRLGVTLESGPRAKPRVRYFYSIMDRATIDPGMVFVSDSLAGDRIVSEETPTAWGLADWPATCQALLDRGKAARGDRHATA